MVIKLHVCRQMNRTEMFLKNAIFLQHFTVVEQFVLQFVKTNKKNDIKHILVFFKFLSKVQSCIAFMLFLLNWKFVSNLCTNTSR